MSHALVDRALMMASRWHRGQKRKYTGVPYITHCEEVVALLQRFGEDDEVVAAGALHDVIEDTEVTFHEIEQWFGFKIAHMVGEVTHITVCGDANRSVRKTIELRRLAMASREAQSIKYADICSNAKDIVSHDPKFAKVYIPEMEKLLQGMTRGNEMLRGKALAIVEIGKLAVDKEAAHGSDNST